MRYIVRRSGAFWLALPFNRSANRFDNGTFGVSGTGGGTGGGGTESRRPKSELPVTVPALDLVPSDIPAKLCRRVLPALFFSRREENISFRFRLRLSLAVSIRIDSAITE